MNSPRQLYKFLSRKKGGVADLVTQAKINQKLSKNLDHLLDPALRGHVCLATVQDQRLTLLANSPAWATRARFSTPALMQKLRNNSHIFGPIKKIEIRVRPAEASPRRQTPAPRHIPRSAADCLRSTAEGIDNEGLRAALERLAQKAEN